MSIILDKPVGVDPRQGAAFWSPSILDDANRISRSYALWSQVMTGDIKGALEVVNSLDDLDRPAHRANQALREMRLWRPEALLRRGLPDLAGETLAAAEAHYGVQWRTRFAHARISYHAGDLDEAARGFGEALVLLKPGAKTTTTFDLTAHAWADALCLSGQYERARDLVERLFAGRDSWKSDNIKALRQTVRSEGDLERFAAILAPSFARQGVASRVALYHYSMACRELGRYRQAEAVIRQRFLTSAEIVGFGTKKPPAKSVRASWAEDARVTLANLKSAVTDAGAEMFLISGTLLGCVRESDILGHDKDIDVGVMEGPQLDKNAVRDAIARSGCFSIKPYQSPTLLRLQHASGVLVDVFWHREENGLIVHEGLKSKWINAPFDLIEHPFLGDQFLIPADYDHYLTENYGNWRVPMTEFETFVDTPNMVVTHEGEMMWYYFCKLFDYYFAGKFDQFVKVADSILRVRPADRQIARVLDSVLRMRSSAA